MSSDEVIRIIMKSIMTRNKMLYWKVQLGWVGRGGTMIFFHSERTSPFLRWYMRSNTFGKIFRLLLLCQTFLFPTKQFQENNCLFYDFADFRFSDSSFFPLQTTWSTWMVIYALHLRKFIASTTSFHTSNVCVDQGYLENLVPLIVFRLFW